MIRDGIEGENDIVEEGVEKTNKEEEIESWHEKKTEDKAENAQTKKEARSDVEAAMNREMQDKQYESKGYEYTLDDKGRIESCFGKLRLEAEERNPKAQIEAGGDYRLETDEGGHLIASRLGGSGEVNNLVAMDANLNHGKYKSMENRWAKELENGNNVEVNIQCEYEGESERPSGFHITEKVTTQEGNVLSNKYTHFRNRSNKGEQ